MTRCLMTASDDLAGEFGVAHDDFADHVRGDLDAVPVPQVDHARDALSIPVGKPVVGRSIARHAFGKIDLRERAIGAFGRRPPASNCIEIEITRRMPSGQNWLASAAMPGPPYWALTPRSFKELLRRFGFLSRRRRRAARLRLSWAQKPILKMLSCRLVFQRGRPKLIC